MNQWMRVSEDGKREPCDAGTNRWLDELHARFRKDAIEHARFEEARADEVKQMLTFGEYVVIGMAAALVCGVVMRFLGY